MIKNKGYNGKDRRKVSIADIIKIAIILFAVIGSYLRMEYRVEILAKDKTNQGVKEEKQDEKIESNEKNIIILQTDVTAIKKTVDKMEMKQEAIFGLVQRIAGKLEVN